MNDADRQLVEDMAREYEGRSRVQLEDLIGAGTAGLLKAESKFDPAKGRDWYSYAEWWIRQRITLAIAESNKRWHTPTLESP